MRHKEEARSCQQEAKHTLVKSDWSISCERKCPSNYLFFFFFLIILIVLASNTARHVNYIPCTCETFCCGCSRSPSTFCLLPLPADDRWLVSRSCVTVEAAHLQSIYLLMTALHHLPSLPHMRVALCGECPSGAFHFSGELNYKLWKLQYEKNKKQTTCSSRVLPLLDLPEESQLIRDDQTT